MLRLVALRFAPAAIILASAGCAASGSASKPAMPDAAQLSRCSVRASHSRPLVVEWPAAERSRFESRSARGLIVVNYSGCDMQVLDECRVSGKYEFIATSRSKDGFTVNNEDELFARLPIGAATLGGELKRSGSLQLNYVVVGQFESQSEETSNWKLEGQCSRATHVVTAYAVGAFTLSTGTTDHKGADATVLGVGAGASTRESVSVVRSGGDLHACEADPADRAAAHCRTPIQLYLKGIEGSRPDAGKGTSDPQADTGASRDSNEPKGQDATKASGVRFLVHLAAGAAGGGTLKIDADGGEATWKSSVGPTGVASLGVRVPVASKLDFQARGGFVFTWLGAESQTQSNDSVRLIAPAGDLTLRYHLSDDGLYAGAGLGGEILFVSLQSKAEGTANATLSTTSFYGIGLLEGGWLFGDSNAWDFGVRGGGGTTVSFDRSPLWWGTLSIGRTLD